jgi:hypothetical protein
VLRPPPPSAPIADVRAAVREALRFPLAGQPLAALVGRGGRVTVVVEPPALPLPSSLADPRQAAIEATVDAIVAAGAPMERQTLLVAGGLSRRSGLHERELLVAPEFARRFRGRVEVHDAEHDDLRDIGMCGHVPLRVHPSLVESDAVVTVTAAETVLHGGPGALLAASGTASLRAAGAYSLLETGASQGWRLALAVEQALTRRVALCGVSLALNTPVLRGALNGYPHDPEAAERLAGSALGRLYARLPSAVRLRILAGLPREVTAMAVLAGPPSVAHAEALIRGAAARGRQLDGRFDALVIGVPETTPYLPRERPNPVLAASLGLGLALRLWRGAFPVAEGGTVVLVHRFRRRFAHPSQQPYRALHQALREGQESDALAGAESAAASDERALTAYREGRACHPLLPFFDWRSCQPALDRLGAVLVAGCRDAAAARSLGLVPTHGLRAAVEMAAGRAEGGSFRLGVLPSPPYFPLRLTDGS